MRRLIILLLVLTLFVGTTSAFSGNGSGTEADPYQITDITQLQEMEDNLTANYTLMNDINASITETWNGGDGFDPISGDFEGTLEGNGYNITNLYINRINETTENTYLGYGLFSTLNGDVNNLKIVDIDIISGNSNMAVYVGAIAGTTYLGDIKNCSASGSIYIPTASNNTKHVGGLSGYVVQSNISNCYTSVNVESPSFVGGFVGFLWDSNVMNCYSYGKVTPMEETAPNGTTIPGGFIASSLTSTTTNCYWDKQKSTIYFSEGGEGRTTDEMTYFYDDNTYVDWDFGNTWELYAPYPKLRYEINTDMHIYPYNQTFNTSVPPFVHEVELDVFRNGAERYDITVSKDGLYANLAYDFSINSPSPFFENYTRSIQLEGGTYYFKVDAYDYKDDLIESKKTEFTINETIDYEGTNVVGGIYERKDGDFIFLENAIVDIYNDTWSDQARTGSNGFYAFNDLNPNSTYFIEVTKTDYQDSSLQTLIPTENETFIKNILLQKRTDESQYYSPHHVEFTLKSFNGMVYDGVQVKVYKGDAATATFTGTTGADGGVSFKLDQNQQYTLELYSDEHGIDTEYTVTPRDTHYNIYVSLWDEPTRGENNVKFFLTQEQINLSAGYINATWNDTSGFTTNVSMWINDTNNTNLYTLTSTSSDGSFSQEVDNNATYLVKFNLESGGLTDTFERTGVITFNAGVNDAFDLGFSEQWHYSLIGAILITLIATFFGVANAHAGAFMVALGGWFMLFIGWFTTVPVTIAMLVLATLISVGFYLRKGEGVT
jgi:hypothetical protein